MPCLPLILGLAFPRVVLVLMLLFTTMLSRTFHGNLLFPLLGFIFLPITTVVYTLLVSNGYPATTGFYLVALIICAVSDLGLIGGGARGRR